MAADAVSQMLHRTFQPINYRHRIRCVAIAAALVLEFCMKLEQERKQKRQKRHYAFFSSLQADKTRLATFINGLDAVIAESHLLI